MTRDEMDASQIQRPKWMVVFNATLLWIFGCSIVGVGIAGLIGEHGSIVFAMLGLAIGVSGAIAHSVLLLVPQFRQRAPLFQGSVLWISTLLLLMILAAVYQSDSALSVATFVATYAAVPTLLAAFAVSWLVNRAAT